MSSKTLDVDCDSSVKALVHVKLVEQCSGFTPPTAKLDLHDNVAGNANV